MKKIILLLFTLFNLLAYSAKTVDYQEVDKYIREKLDKNKEITFVYKLNSADNTLEGYSDEGKLTAVTDLKDNPSQAAMNGMKSVISEKNGKLNPSYKIFAADGKLLTEQKYKLNKPIRLFDTGVLFAYLDLQAPYSEQLQKLIDSIDSIEIVGYHPNNAKYIKNTTFNHKTNKVKIEVKDYTQNPALFTTTNLDIKTMSGTVESFYPSGKLSAVSTLKNGALNGETKAYYENGKLRFTGNYKDNKFDGIITSYSENGEINRQSEFKEDVLIREIK